MEVGAKEEMRWSKARRDEVHSFGRFHVATSNLLNLYLYYCPSHASPIQTKNKIKIK